MQLVIPRRQLAPAAVLVVLAALAGCANGGSSGAAATARIAIKTTGLQTFVNSSATAAVAVPTQTVVANAVERRAPASPAPATYYKQHRGKPESTGAATAANGYLPDRRARFRLATAATTGGMPISL